MAKMIFGLEQVLMYRKEMEKVRKMEFNSVIWKNIIRWQPALIHLLIRLPGLAIIIIA